MENTARSLERKLNETIDSEIDKALKADTQLILACCDGLLRLDDVSRYTMSAQAYREKLNQITGFSERARQRRKTVKALLIAATIAALLAVAAFGYAQVKYNIFHFSDHSAVFLENKNDKKVNELTVDYVPKGFSLSNEIRQQNSIMLEYEKDELYINILKGSVHDQMTLNTEHSEYKTVQINNIEYIVYGEETHGRGVLWITNGYTYNLLGNLEEDEMIKIAVSVR